PVSSDSSAAIRTLAASRSVCEAVCLNVEPAGQVEPDVGVVIAAPPAEGTHMLIGLSAAAFPASAKPPISTAPVTPLRQPAMRRPPRSIGWADATRRYLCVAGDLPHPPGSRSRTGQARTLPGVKLTYLPDVEPRPRRVAIGTFDGVHLGHREV